MLNKNQQLGIESEAFALKYLKKRRYKILQKNFRTKFGEIDIIAKDKDTIAFIEVKARSSDRFGPPKGAITPWKQKKISMAALSYLKATNQPGAKARFDVVSIRFKNKKPEIEIIKNAFEVAFN